MTLMTNNIYIRNTNGSWEVIEENFFGGQRRRRCSPPTCVKECARVYPRAHYFKSDGFFDCEPMRSSEFREMFESSFEDDELEAVETPLDPTTTAIGLGLGALLVGAAAILQARKR